MYNLTQFVLRSLISFSLVFFLCMFLLSVYTCKSFYTSHLHTYIFTVNFTIHLIMTEVRSKRRVLPLIYIVKSFKKPLLVRLIRIACDNVLGFVEPS